MSYCMEIYKEWYERGGCRLLWIYSTYKLDLTCIATCYHHLVVIFYSLSISLKDLHVCTGLGIKRSSHVWDSEKNATAP